MIAIERIKSIRDLRIGDVICYIPNPMRPSEVGTHDVIDVNYYIAQAVIRPNYNLNAPSFVISDLYNLSQVTAVYRKETEWDL